MHYETLKIDVVPEGWAELTFHRPEVLNAVNLKMVTELTDALGVLAARDDVRGLLLSGAGGKAFVAGADISELVKRTVDDALKAINAGVFQKLEDFPWPTVAAIQGFALGGGCELALACDVRFCSPESLFGQPEVKLGIIPGAGAPHRLTRTVGPGRARELILSGRAVKADEAERIGLVNRVIAPPETPVDAARAFLKQCVANAPLAVRLAKVALNAAVNTVDRRSTMVEYLSQGILFDTDEKTRRMTDFLEKKAKK
ncbi:MAG TPA: enoyl-CoA hydratase-related protein [Planctomycetota bacterium]|nr:enoyl-CoA hydratase-related protein [Planctomycetota bacterium]